MGPQTGSRFLLSAQSLARADHWSTWLCRCPRCLPPLLPCHSFHRKLDFTCTSSYDTPHTAAFNTRFTLALTPLSLDALAIRFLTLQKAEEEAAKVYEEFVDSFGSGSKEEPRRGSHGGAGGGGGGAGGGMGGPKAFLRGGTVMPGGRQMEPGETGGGEGERGLMVGASHGERGCWRAQGVPEGRNGHAWGAADEAR